MELIRIDEAGRLFISPAIDDWQPIQQQGIKVIVDLEGDLDRGVSTIPNHLLYVYFPIHDGELPDLSLLSALAGLGASLIQNGHKVLSHCGMGFNRSALVAGLILTQMGIEGDRAVSLLRERRPGALFNETFARYLESVCAVR